MSLDIVRAAALDGVPHGFFGRHGGVSPARLPGSIAGMGSGDDPEAVEANRRLAADAILSGRAARQRLPDPLSYRRDRQPMPRPMANGRRPTPWSPTGRDLLLGVVTADCAPVLLADAEAGVIGAAHAGWRGAMAGVTDQAIAAMISLGARIERIAAAVGPCIARASYEVDHGFCRAGAGRRRRQ